MRVYEGSSKRRRGRVRERVRRFAAAGVSAVVAAAMVFSSVAAYATDWSESKVTENGITIDKTATGLDENDQTDVTLKIGGEQDVNNVAVLFVLDYSTSTDVREEAAAFLSELAKKDNTNVKTCVINYWSDADTGTWTTIDEGTDTDTLLAQPTASGTNYHAGLLAAQKALESDEIAGYETYLITISDGITYLWTNEETGETQSVWYQNRGNGLTDIQNGNSVYDMKYHGAAIDEDYFNELVDGSENVLTQYANTEPFFVSWDNSTKPDGTTTTANDSTVEGTPYLSYNGDDYEDIMSNYLIGTEVAIYKTAGVWSSLVDSVDYAYAFKLDENHWDSYPYGEQLMDWMIGEADNGTVESLTNGEISDDTAAATFATISNQIIYTIQSGTVTDVIGDDFDLAGLDTFTLTVGENTYVGTVDEDASTVTFDDSNYVVTYYPDGENGEYFTWEINVPVESANPVELTYTLTLVNKSEVAGEYTVPTNESATLIPNGEEDDKMVFPEPVVTYTVKATEETPGDGGGDGTTGTGGGGAAADAGSDGVAADASSGSLPQTGDPLSVAAVAAAAAAGAGAIGLGALLSRRRG